MRDGLRVFALLNQADAQGADNGEAVQVVRGMEGVELLPVSLGRRKAFASAAGAGVVSTGNKSERCKGLRRSRCAY